MGAAPTEIRIPPMAWMPEEQDQGAGSLHGRSQSQYRGRAGEERGMNVGLDTSVVLRLLIGKPPAQTAVAVAFLDDLQRRGDCAVVSDLVISEAYFALQFHFKVTKAEALSSLVLLLSTGEIAATGQSGKVLAQAGLASAKPGFVDHLIHAHYTAAGGTMATFEKSAGKLPKVTVLK
jgi:predicted nucleic acid-binding protein